MNDHSTSVVDLRIIDDLLVAIDRGECPNLARVEGELRAIRAKLASLMCDSCPDQPAADDLTQLLRRDAECANEARTVVARIALDFLKSQHDYFSQLHAEGGLTEEEKRFGREHLIPILDGLRSMFAGRDSEGASNTEKDTYSGDAGEVG